MRPRIGIFAAPTVVPHPVFHTLKLSAQKRSYSDAIERNGGIPILLPLTADRSVLHAMLDICDGVLFPGGGDVHPKYYGEEPRPYLGEVDTAIDEMQLAALAYLERRQIPVFGICRGCQVINIYCGGSVWQDLASEYGNKLLLHAQTARRSCAMHRVHIARESRLSSILGTDMVETNTMHHQAVRRLGISLRPAAHTSDGVIEAIEHENGIWMGVQWHPEELSESVFETDRLFAAFLACAARQKEKNER